MESGEGRSQPRRERVRIVHFADLHLGVENYGSINPVSGLSTRLEDCLAALDRLVDYALNNEVDLVLFCGDTYKNREPSQTQQREFARRINRLTSGGVPIFLLAGNHDMSNAAGRATTIEIFSTLSLDNVYVSNRPDIYRIPTSAGLIQIVSLPWLRRSSLLSKEETKNLDFAGINEKLQEILANIIATNAARLDPTIPAILAAHVWVSGAKIGSESSMTIGQEHSLLLSNILHPAFDYIALGHIHKHQVLCEDPHTIYAGSMERLYFSEEKEEKGFYVVDIEPDSTSGKRNTTFSFHPGQPRRFLTIAVDIDKCEANPTARVLTAIAEQENEIKDAIVRVNLILPAEIEDQLKDQPIRKALREASYFSISREVKREARLRLGAQKAEEITPGDALRAYLESKKTTPERLNTLLEYGQRLILEKRTGEGETPS